MRSKRGISEKLLSWPDLVLLVFFIAFLALALAGSLSPADGTSTVGAAFMPPSAEHPLGTDGLGRDVLARLMHGGAHLIAVAAVSTAVAAAVGVALGFAVSAKGRFADVLSYLLDLLLVIPSILVVMVLVFGLGSGVGTMIVVTTAVSAPYIARYTRSLVRPVAASPYVTAARLSGDSAAKTAVREVLPNLAVPLATTVGMRFINSVYLVATAAFLGFDPLGTGSDWGTMIQTGVTGISLNPWAALAPTIAIACITISGNLLLDRIGKRSNL